MMKDHDIATSMRNALRRFAKAVAVITARTEQGHLAMAATAVCELSLNPPSMLVCVNRNASLHSALTADSAFCINILHASQADISTACGGTLKGEDRFGLGEWIETDLGARRLADAQASFLCIQESAIVAGTHSIFVGLVQRVYVQREVDPLVYVDGRYGRVGTEILS
jgi:flavin reductase (DIM6/NTAB) family NADH-FMN oxidoreductase RutF